MKKNPWSAWAAAVVMAAALSIGSAGSADARLGGGMRLPVDDTVEVNGLGANHQGAMASPPCVAPGSA